MVKYFFNHDRNGPYEDMMVQIIDFCDPNEQEKRENFLMHKLQTPYPEGLNLGNLRLSLLCDLWGGFTRCKI